MKGYLRFATTEDLIVIDSKNKLIYAAPITLLAIHFSLLTFNQIILMKLLLKCFTVL